MTANLVEVDYPCLWRDYVRRCVEPVEDIQAAIAGHDARDAVNVGGQIRSVVDWRRYIQHVQDRYVPLLEQHGPWDSECNAYCGDIDGVPVQVVRNRYGTLCGYVGVPGDHPWITKMVKDDADYVYGVDCHGGCTYVGGAVLPSEDKNLTWVGFDCGHSCDGGPMDLQDEHYRAEKYRPLSFVLNELTKIVAQASAAAAQADVSR